MFCLFWRKREIALSVTIKKVFKIELYQIYPITHISYSISKQNRVVLSVFDIKGRILKTLENTVKRAGNHQINFNYQNIPNGTYFINLRVGNNSITKKMLVLK